jgi:hypothetical protein
MKNKLWFKRKTYGYGWTPVTLEGWVFTIGWIVALSLLITNINQDWINLAVLIAMSGILFFVCYKKGEKPRWQWRKGK